MWLTWMWSRTNQEIHASVLKRILLNIITPLVCTTVLHTKPFHPQQYSLSIRQRPTYTQETILRLGSRFPVRAEKSCFAPIPRPLKSGGHTSGIKAAMAYKLHIPDCILEPHHPFHFPTPNKPLRIRIQGPLISIQRLIPKAQWQWFLNWTEPPQVPAPDFAGFTHRTIYGCDPQPGVPDDLVIRHEYCGWISNPPLPIEWVRHSKTRGGHPRGPMGQKIPKPTGPRLICTLWGIYLNIDFSIISTNFTVKKATGSWVVDPRAF